MAFERMLIDESITVVCPYCQANTEVYWPHIAIAVPGVNDQLSTDDGSSEDVCSHCQQKFSLTVQARAVVARKDV